MADSDTSREAEDELYRCPRCPGSVVFDWAQHSAWHDRADRIMTGERVAGGFLGVAKPAG